MEKTEDGTIIKDLKDYLSGIKECSICGGTKFTVTLDPREVQIDLSTNKLEEAENLLGVISAQCSQCNEPY